MQNDIARGNLQGTYVLAVALTPGSTATVTSAEQSFTVPGILVGDQISNITFQGAWTVLVDIVNTRVISNNTLGVSFQNNTAGTLSAPTGTYLIEVNRPSQLPLPNGIQ